MRVRVTHTAEGFEVEGQCTADASGAEAWDVLTDYNGIDRFVSSMRESRVSGHIDHDVLVEQVAVGRLFLFSRRLHTVLRVHEEPVKEIRFEDVLGRDFARYRGDWRIERPAETRVTRGVYRGPRLSREAKRRLRRHASRFNCIQRLSLPRLALRPAVADNHITSA